MPPPTAPAPEPVPEPARQPVQQPVATAQTVTPAPAPAPTPTPEPEAAATPPAPATPAPPADPYTALLENATAMMTATEDPVYKKQFNSTLLNLGMQNQASMDQVKARVNADPALAGQGAGNALINMMARDLNLNAGQVMAQLDIASAQRIADLNRYGFEQLQQVVQNRNSWAKQQRDDLLDAGDIDGWADAFERETGLTVDRDAVKSQSPAVLKAVSTMTDAINNNIRGGNEARARELFEQMKALDPDQFGALTFDDYVNARGLWAAANEEKQNVLESVRDLIANDDVAGALNGLQTLYDEEEAALGGRKLIDGGMELEEVNRLLEQAGYDAVESMDELIGLEDELFIASELDKIKTKYDEANWLDTTASALIADFAKTDMGEAALTPEFSRAVKTYLMTLQTMGAVTFDAAGNPVIDYSKVLPPWDEKSPLSTQFTAWPLPGSSEFDPDMPSEATDPMLYQRNQALNSAYTAYIKANPDAASRLGREEWYNALVAEVPGVADGSASVPSGWKPTAAAPADAKWTKATTVAEIEQLILGEGDIANIPWDNPLVQAWVNTVPNTTSTAVNNIIHDAKNNKGVGEWKKINGQMYRVEKGSAQWYSGSQNEKRHRDYLTVTGPDGQTAYISMDGRMTTTPPPSGGSAKDRDAFKAWYDSMGAA